MTLVQENHQLALPEINLTDYLGVLKLNCFFQHKIYHHTQKQQSVRLHLYQSQPPATDANIPFLHRAHALMLVLQKLYGCPQT